MSLLVTNDPKGPIAAPALRDLEVGVELFENAAPSCQPAHNLLVIALPVVATNVPPDIPFPSPQHGSCFKLQEKQLVSYQ
jgi:hypothetical protein